MKWLLVNEVPKEASNAQGRATAQYGIAIFASMGYMGLVKTTLEISDALFQRAKRLAKRTGRPMRALVEEGLRRVLDDEKPANSYRLPDRSVGKPGAPNPLESMDWAALRGEIYGGR